MCKLTMYPDVVELGKKTTLVKGKSQTSVFITNRNDALYIITYYKSNHF